MLCKIYNFFQKMKEKRKNNKGMVPVLLAIIATGVFMPTLAIVYDLANMRLYKTDITNIAQMAVLSCVAHTGNTFHMDSCRKTIKNIIAINLFNEVVDPTDENQPARAGAAFEQGANWKHPLPDEVFKKYFKRPYSASSLETTMNNVIINPLANDRGFYVVMFTSYKPTFMKFGDWGTNGIEIRSRPVVVSASYICQHAEKCAELDGAYRKQKQLEDQVDQEANEIAKQRKNRERVGNVNVPKQ